MAARVIEPMVRGSGMTLPLLLRCRLLVLGRFSRGTLKRNADWRPGTRRETRVRKTDAERNEPHERHAGCPATSLIAVTKHRMHDSNSFRKYPQGPLVHVDANQPKVLCQPYGVRVAKRRAFGRTLTHGAFGGALRSREACLAVERGHPLCTKGGCPAHSQRCMRMPAGAGGWAKLLCHPARLRDIKTPPPRSPYIGS